MTAKYLTALALALALAVPAPAAWAMPVLRASVVVTTGVVTAGDMFQDAGDHAATPLFRAPLPGTVGAVGIGVL